MKHLRIIPPQESSKTSIQMKIHGASVRTGELSPHTERMLQNLQFLKKGCERSEGKPTNFSSLDDDQVENLPSPLQLEF